MGGYRVDLYEACGVGGFGLNFQGLQFDGEGVRFSLGFRSDSSSNGFLQPSMKVWGVEFGDLGVGSCCS